MGYQADISQPAAPYLGAIYDEHGRKMLAKRGQVTTIAEDGTMVTADVETPEQAAAGIDITQWTDYEISFIDNVMSVRVGGKDMSEIVDNQESEREMSGILALQLHSGPPMKVAVQGHLAEKAAVAGPRCGFLTGWGRDGVSASRPGGTRLECLSSQALNPRRLFSKLPLFTAFLTQSVSTLRHPAQKSSPRRRNVPT